MSEQPEIDLKALGVYDQGEIAESAYARVLVLGPSKAGKTTCIAGTAPSPLVINCDGPNATKGAANQGAKFMAVDANSRATWKQARQTARKLVEAGVCKTVIVDTVSLLSDNLLDELEASGFKGWDLWGELATLLVAGCKELFKLDAHVFIIAHMSPDADVAAGILPAIGGKAKIRLPALVDDWVLLDVEPDRKPPRQFLLGPQKTWTHSGRNVKKTCAIEATVPRLFEELGIPL